MSDEEANNEIPLLDQLFLYEIGVTKARRYAKKEFKKLSKSLLEQSEK